MSKSVRAILTVGWGLLGVILLAKVACFDAPIYLGYVIADRFDAKTGRTEALTVHTSEILFRSVSSALSFWMAWFFLKPRASSD